MTAWITHLLIFLVGVGVGGFLSASRRRGSAQQMALKTLRRLNKECPEFFNDLREELGKVEFRDVREFAIIESSQVTFVSEDLKFVYYEDELSNLKGVAVELEEHGFIDDVTRGRIPTYRMRENFVKAIGSL